MKLAEEKKSSGSSSSKLYVATNQTRQNLLQVRGCLLKRCMHCMHTCIASTICIQDYVHPKRKRFFCALPYVRAYTLCVQMHKHKCIHAAACLPIGQCNFCFAFGFDSGIRAFDYCLNVQIITIRKCILLHKYSGKHTHARNECAFLRARASLAFYVCV